MSLDPNIIDESKDAAVSVAAAESTHAGSSESAEQSEQATEFDSALYEQTFGLPEGSLKDTTDAATALDLIKAFTDRTLIAGMAGFAGEADIPESKLPAEQPAKKKAKEPENPEYAAIRAELDEVKGLLRNQKQHQEAVQMAEVKRRIFTKIDSWKSAKYGVGSARTYKQTKEANEIAGLVFQHAQAARQAGAYEPQVEASLERLRLVHDDTYELPKKAAPQLGTPGSGGKAGSKGENQPRSIHYALLGNPTGF